MLMEVDGEIELKKTKEKNEKATKRILLEGRRGGRVFIDKLSSLFSRNFIFEKVIKKLNSNPPLLNKNSWIHQDWKFIIIIF